jgi:hypothetical protein
VEQRLGFAAFHPPPPLPAETIMNLKGYSVSGT